MRNQTGERRGYPLSVFGAFLAAPLTVLSPIRLFLPGACGMVEGHVVHSNIGFPPSSKLFLTGPTHDRRGAQGVEKHSTSSAPWGAAGNAPIRVSAGSFPESGRHLAPAIRFTIQITMLEEFHAGAVHAAISTV